MTLLASGPFSGAAAASGDSAPQLPPTAPLTATANPGALPTLEWSLRGSSDQINVLPNLQCDLGPDRPGSYLDAGDPCLWVVDHLAPLPGGTPAGCAAAREPGVGGPASYASWRCDMRQFRDVVIRAAQNANDRSFVMFNTQATGGSGRCATIPITVLLGSGTGELQAADGCAQTIRCETVYRGVVKADPLDTVTGCTTPPPGSPPGSGGSGSGGGGGTGAGGGGGGRGEGGLGGGGGSSVPPAPGGGTKTGSGSGTKTKPERTGRACPGASSGRKGNSPLYSVYIKAQGKRGMKIYVHMRRAVPITVDVRMRRSGGAKVVRWVSRCAKKGNNVITLPNATGGAQSRRNYRVIVKSPNSTYPLRSSWEALPRR